MLYRFGQQFQRNRFYRTPDGQRFHLIDGCEGIGSKDIVEYRAAYSSLTDTHSWPECSFNRLRLPNTRGDSWYYAEVLTGTSPHAALTAGRVKTHNMMMG